MRQELITSSLFRRMRQRSNLLLVLLVGGLFSTFRLVAGGPWFSVADMAMPFVLLTCHLALSPIPWQWTGDDRSRAGLGRGFLQALCFDAGWVALVMVLLHMGGSARSDRPPRSMGPPPEGREVFRTPPPPRPLNPGLGLGLVNVSFAIAFGWVFAEKEATEAKERRTADLLRLSRSRALQNQLEPHVLYNALNGLSELVHEDPLAAEEVIARLADLYRMLTVHGNADLVSLGQERILLEAYLAMEQMRLGERLKVRWEWPAWVDEIPIPPLLLQPLVENAIKHGISPSDPGGELVITCSREGHVIRIAILNTGCPLKDGFKLGTGLSNLHERLTLWLGASPVFRLDGLADWTLATLRWTPGIPS